jgi:hypothetical protein
VEVTSRPRRFPVFSPLGRSIFVLLAAAFVAFQLGKDEVTPLTLLAIATAVALVVAIQLVPHGPAYIRKPEQEPDKIALRKIKSEPAFLKRAYSPPQLTRLESRDVSEPAWESQDEDESFRALRAFYVVYPRRNFTVVAASWKFHGDKEYRSWQPIADSPPAGSTAGVPDEQYQWVLIGYVPPNVKFDAKLKLRDSQSKLGVALARSVVASQDRPFQSVHLKFPLSAEHLVTC